MDSMRLVVCCMLSAVCCVPAQVCAEELRDPFTFGPRAGEVQHAQPTLIGVLWDATHPLAIVGEEMVGVGAVIAGWRITEIKQEGIVVQRDERREFLTPGSPLPSD